MSNTSRLGGIGGIAFGVLTFVAFVLASPPGGSYTESSVTDFVANGHRTAVIVSLYLMLFAVVGLLAMLRELTRGSLASALGVMGAAGIAIGWGLGMTPALAMAYGGNTSIDPKVGYTISEGGFVMLCGVGGVLLGLALIVIALRMRGWVRWFTGVVGVLGLASPAWFPFFALVLGSIVLGIWLLTARREPTTA